MKEKESGKQIYSVRGYAGKAFWVLCTFGLLRSPLVDRSAFPAQSSGNETLRVEVNLATVEVSATDKKGHPVTGLVKEDFKLWVDGKEQEILTSDEIRLDDDTRKNRPGKVVLILFDDTRTAVSQLQPSREAAQLYVTEHLGPQDLGAVVVQKTEVRIIQNFTKDTLKVIDAIKKSAQSISFGQPELPSLGTEGSASGFESNIGQYSRSQGGLGDPDLSRTLKFLSAQMKRIKGRKAILVFSNSPSPTHSAGVQSDAEARYRSAFDQDVERAVDTSKHSLVPIYNIEAKKTNDWNDQLMRIEAELSSYYVLSFRPVNAEIKSKLRRVVVKTTSKESRLSYRNELDVLERESPRVGSKTEQSLMLALNSPSLLNHLPISFRAVYFYTNQNSVRVVISASVETKSLKFTKEKGHRVCSLDVMGIVLGENGDTVARFNESYEIVQESKSREGPDSGPWYRRVITLRPAKYRIRLAIAENEEKLGSAELSLVIPAMPLNRMYMSSLVLTQRLLPLPALIQDIQERLMQEDDPLVYKAFQVVVPPDIQLDRQKPMVIFFKLYRVEGNGEAPPDLTARLQLSAEGGQESPSVSLSLASAAIPSGGGEYASAVVLPISELLPGKYRLTAEITNRRTNESTNGQASLEVR